LEEEHMRRDVLWGAVFVIIIGSVLILLGAVISYGALWDLGTGTSSYSEADEAYEIAVKGSMIQSLGTIVALVGIAMGFVGAAVSDPRERTIQRVPAYQQVQPQYQREPIVYACPTCESVLTWIPEKSEHYCFQCREFA
jgi:hypothetical protein